MWVNNGVIKKNKKTKNILTGSVCYFTLFFAGDTAWGGGRSGTMPVGGRVAGKGGAVYSSSHNGTMIALIFSTSFFSLSL